MALTKISTGMLKQDAASSDLNIDAGTLYIDVSNNRVGVANTSPVSTLQVNVGTNLNLGINESSSTVRLSAYNDAASSSVPVTINSSSTRFNISDTERMRIDSSGNVGIGTTSFAATYDKLAVAGGIHIQDDNNAKLEIGRYSSAASNSYIKLGANSNSLRITNAADNEDIFTIKNNGNVGIGTTSPSFTSGGGLQVYNAGQANVRISSTVYHTDFAQSGADTYLINRTTNGDIKFRVNSSTELLTLDGGTGSVGIAQTSPSSTYKLDVGGSVRSATAAPSFALQETDASNQTWLLGSYGGTFAIRDVTGGTYPVYVEQATPSSTLYLDSTGNVGIGTGSPAAPLHVKHASGEAKVIIQAGSNTSSAVLQFGDSLDSSRGGIEYTSTDDMAFSTNNMTEAMRIRYTGKVGIGTTSPSSKLTVNGTSSVTAVAGSKDIESKRWVSKFTSSSAHNVAIVSMLSGDGASQLAGFVFTFTYRTSYGFNSGGGGHGVLMISGRVSNTGTWTFDTSDSTLVGDGPDPTVSGTDNGNSTATITITTPSSTHAFGELNLTAWDCTITSPT